MSDIIEATKPYRPLILNIPKTIHPTAIIASGAQLGPDVAIGPYSIIGENVSIGAHTLVGSHVVIEGNTTIGERNQICTGAIIGNAPQDLKFDGEETFVTIGNDNIIREYVTINRGTQGGGSITRIGDHNVLLTAMHVAHDVWIKNHVVISNSVAIAGHVIIDDWVTIGGLAGIHQFTRIGTMAMVGSISKITKDIPPFTLVNGNPAKLCGLNTERLRRNQFSLETRLLLQRAYKILFHSKLDMEAAIEKIEQDIPPSSEIDLIIKFIQGSTYGFYR